MRVVFGNRGKSLTIEGPPGSVLESARSLYPGAQIDPASTADGPADLVVRAGAEGGWELRSPIDPAPRAFADPPDLLNAIEFGVTHFLLLGERDLTHLHAAGAVVPERGARGAVLALGPSGSGKSSIALFWARAGLPLLGDDIVLLGDEAELRPFPRSLKVRSERLRDAGIVPPGPRLFDPETLEARYDPAHGAGWAEPGVRAAVVARVRWTPGAALRIEPMATADALRLVLDSVLDTGVGPHESFARVAELLDRARCVDVTFGEAAEAARALIELEPR